MMTVSNNLLALNATNQLKTNVSNKIKSMEKLSSGYRINKAADDAAGLSISEKMRHMIRGLDQGTKNVQDGASWVQTGDGALDDAHAIIHRMTELTIQSLNDTNTDEDRMALELEFESLQSELDRIGGTTTFNTKPIFEEHESPFYQCEGNIKWDPQQIHVISNGSNDLSFTYRVTDDSPQETVTITVPPGQYTTQELVDEIESALSALPPKDEELVFEFTPEGTCNATIEGGTAIDTVSGGLSYLLNKVYGGGGFGALIGTTEFPTEHSKINIAKDKNDTMTFTIEDFSGKSTTKTIVIQPPGGYTKNDIINIINDQLKDTTVKAVSKGTGIKLQSDDSIVTGFKGNMFQIDEKGGMVYDSVFYDNTKYGTVTKTEATFAGGYVLPTNPKDKEHQFYDIKTGINDTLVLQPNTTENPVTITIPEGRYTVSEMQKFLEKAFTDNKLDVTVEDKTNNGFQGLFLKSNLKGLDSHINIDNTCSAYDTLFVTREYNIYGPYAEVKNETHVNKEALYKASKDLTAITPTTPLEIKPGVNDSFTITIDGTPSTIKLDAPKTYKNMQDLVDYIDDCLNGPSAKVAYKGKTLVWQENGQIRIGGVPTEQVNSIRISANGNNKGYNDIFVGYREYPLPDKSSYGSVTLDTPFDGTNNSGNMTIIVGNDSHNIKLPTGNPVTEDQITEAINNQLKPETIENKCPRTTGKGTSGDQNFSSTATGKNNPPVSWSGSNTGTSYKPEGVVDFVTNTPAKLTIGPELKSNMHIGAGNNEIQLTLNGIKKTLTLDDGDYIPSSLVTHLQDKINEAFTDGLGGAIVSLDGNQLVLESRLPEPEFMDAKQTSISCSTSTSSFLRDLNTTKQPAVWTSKLPLSTDITIGPANRTFKFELTQDGKTDTISVNLPIGGPYTPSAIASAIDRQLSGTGVNASLSSGKLALTSDKAGGDVSIKYDTKQGGSSVEALFGSMTAEKPAQAVVNQKTESPIIIKQGESDIFNITVNGKSYSIKDLTPGSYDRNGFVRMLNQKFTDNNIDLKAYVSGDKLGFQTVTAKGTSASFTLDYDKGGTSMKSIFGVTKIPGVTASFTPDGKLTLSSPGNKITVPSANGGPFQPKTELRAVSPTYTDGYHSTTNSSILGQPLSGDVEINEWNNSLSFTYRDGNTTRQITISNIPDGIYSFSKLEEDLQKLVDSKVGGKDKIKVTVTNNGVHFQAMEVGSKYQFGSPQGSFADKVLGHYKEITANQTTDNKDGTQTVNPAYIVGRKDVKNEGADIRKGYTDKLSLDLTYDGKEYPISITLDEGKYSGDALQKHLQEKINEQLVANGLEENTIVVGLGDIITGVQNANDHNAINFSLPQTDDKVRLPEEGKYIIDGVRGNAAFEIFYQTEGKIIPSYIVGTKDISHGMAIKPGETEFSLEVDGVPYTVKLNEGEYPTPDDLVAEVSRGLEAAGAPLFAVMENNCLKISHKQTGEHVIDKVQGDARDVLFYTEKGNKEEKPPFYIKPNSIKDDHIAITRHRFSTAYLKINSICISKPKYAEKALERLNTALQMTSEIRSDFGATQNRLEYAANNNRNIAENTQQSASRIRDANMAEEMVRLANSSILQQASEAILAQANQQPQGILNLFSA